MCRSTKEQVACVMRWASCATVAGLHVFSALALANLNSDLGRHVAPPSGSSGNKFYAPHSLSRLAAAFLLACSQHRIAQAFAKLKSEPACERIHCCPGHV